MSKEFERMGKILIKEFGKNRKMYLATSSQNVPKVRLVNTFYWDRSFYLVTHESSELMQNFIKNGKVSLNTTSSFHKFQGEAVNMGHPLKEENKAIRDVFKEAMADWCFDNSDESDAKLCFVQIKIVTGFTYANKIGYKVDFGTNELKSFRFAPNS